MVLTDKFFSLIVGSINGDISLGFHIRLEIDKVKDVEHPFETYKQCTISEFTEDSFNCLLVTNENWDYSVCISIANRLTPCAISDIIEIPGPDGITRLDNDTKVKIVEWANDVKFFNRVPIGTNWTYARMLLDEFRTESLFKASR